MKRSLSGLLILCSALFSAVPVFGGCPTPLSCPANITKANDANQCGSVTNFNLPLGCGGGATVTATPASGSFFPVGTTQVTLTDSAGSPSCNFTITINDTQPPAITCPSDVFLLTPVPTAVNFAAPQSSDNCPGIATVCTPASGSTFPIGSTLDSCTTTDASNNTGTCTFDVELENPADLAVIKNDTPDPVEAGANLTYTINVINNGPADAQNVSLDDVIPANTTFVSFNAASAGWTTTSPAVGGTAPPINAFKTSVANGETATFTLVVKVDNGVPDGTVITNTATITGESPGDDDTGNNSSTTTTSVGLPQITIDDVTVTEPASGTVDACFTVSLSKPSDQTVTVQAAAVDGTAVSNADFLSDSGGINFPAGETSETICVTVNSDLLDESDENFFVNLSNPTNATIGDDQGVGTILDVNAPPVVNNNNIEGSGCLLAKGANGTMVYPFLSLGLAVGILAVRRRSSHLHK